MPARRAVSSTVSWRCSRARASADSSPVGSSGSTSSMPVVILLLVAATFRFIGEIDVAWRAEVVAGHVRGREVSQAGIRHVLPDAPREQQRMEAHSAVGGCNSLVGAGTPRPDDPVDRAWIDSRAVSQDDDGRLHLVTERPEAAAERGARPAFPIRAVHDAGAALHLVRAEHNDDLVDLGALSDTLQDRLEQHRLLRRAVARRCARRQDNRRDQTSVMRSTTTLRVGFSVTRFPSWPMRSTTFRPFVTTPRMA